MRSFFDTSAIVPLIFKEPHSDAARAAWKASSVRLGWQWLRVEAEAALTQRSGSLEAWNLWRRIESAIEWVEPHTDWYGHLRSFNRSLGLRAADAGHLYVMERCLESVPDLTLMTFDQEMAKAAASRGLGLWQA